MPRATSTSAVPSRNLGLLERRESSTLRMMPMGAAKFFSVALVYLDDVCS